jgi:hypothetical protein
VIYSQLIVIRQLIEQLIIEILQKWLYKSRYANGNGSVVAFCLCTNFDGREPESQLAKDIDRKVFEARNNKQWRREYMSYQMELDKQFRNGREEGREEGMDNISKLLKLLVSEKKYDEIEKISEDKEYQKELLKKYKIIE